MIAGGNLNNGRFLSTPSARRATMYSARAPRTSRHFYPRPPRGGRRTFGVCALPTENISIHALREEGDEDSIKANVAAWTISIHALREEGDAQSAARAST